MATLGAKYLDLIDIYKQSEDVNLQQAAVIIELLAETNEILDDAIAVPCNKGTTHLTTVRTGLPEVAWGMLYKGVSQSKGETAQVEDSCGFLEALAQVDKRLTDIAANVGAVRLSEARSFLESLSQAAAKAMFYGNIAANPEQFTGLAPRFSDLSAPNGYQIVDAGGQGADNTSFWFVTWGENQTHLIYPKAAQGGIKREDKGEQKTLDEQGNPYWTLDELFRWWLGLTVRDWRQVVRIANIDVSDLRAGTVDIYKFLRQGYYRLKNHKVSGGRIVGYCNAEVREALDAATTPTTSTSGSYVRLTPMQVDGEEVMGYRQIPIRQCDALLNTEERVT